MNLNKKFIIIGLVLLALSWVGNVFFYEKHILKEPIFVSHYYDIQNGIDSMMLYYIQDIDSKDEASNIEFPEIGQVPVNFTDINIRTGSRYYKLKCISITFYNGDQDKVSDNLRNKVITKAKVTFTNGKVINEDIGKIYLHCDNTSNPALTIENASSSNGNTGSSTFRATKDIKITGLYTKFPDISTDIVSVKFNEKELKDIKFPLELKMGEDLKISYEFQFDKDDTRKNNAYNFPINILTEDRNGVKGQDSCFVTYWLSSPDKYNVELLRLSRR